MQGDVPVTIIGLDPSYQRTGISDGTHHGVILTKSDPSLTQEQNCYDRMNKVLVGILDFAAENNVGLIDMYVEGPMLRVPKHGGTHLYEIGWYMALLHSKYDHMKIVQNTTLKAYICGNGQATPQQVRRELDERWGIRIERDSGNDKLFACCLALYGGAVERGEIRHTPSVHRRAPRKGKRDSVEVRTGT